MTDRKRKKWLKKHGKYINPKECWDLDLTISEFVLPRLKMFKKHNIAYPGRGEMDTFEKWNEALDKMIKAFELNIKFDELSDKYYDEEFHFLREKWEKDDKDRREGMYLFAEYFTSLWW